jgi:hypothetical protein
MKARVLRWSTKAQLLLPAVRQHRELAVLVDSETGVVVAHEVPRIPNVKDALDSGQRVSIVFDQRAHKYVGSGTSLVDALQLAEDYARAWVESEA